MPSVWREEQGLSLGKDPQSKASVDEGDRSELIINDFKVAFSEV